MSDFSIASLYIACLLALVVQASQVLQIDHRPAGFEISYHDNISGQFLDSSCIKNESVCQYYSRTLFANNVDEDCWYIKNRL